MFDKEQNLWIQNCAEAYETKDSIYTIKVKKLDDGFEIDLSEHNGDVWCSRFPNPYGVFPIINLKGFEQWKINVEERKKERALREKRKKEILKKLDPEERVILGFKDEIE